MHGRVFHNVSNKKISFLDLLKTRSPAVAWSTKEELPIKIQHREGLIYFRTSLPCFSIWYQCSDGLFIICRSRPQSYQTLGALIEMPNYEKWYLLFIFLLFFSFWCLCMKFEQSFNLTLWHFGQLKQSSLLERNKIYSTYQKRKNKKYSMRHWADKVSSLLIIWLECEEGQGKWVRKRKVFTFYGRMEMEWVNGRRVLVGWKERLARRVYFKISFGVYAYRKNCFSVFEPTNYFL